MTFGLAGGGRSKRQDDWRLSDETAIKRQMVLCGLLCRPSCWAHYCQDVRDDWRLNEMGTNRESEDRERAAFYDLVYEAYRQGKDSDAVDRDRFDDMRASGYYPDEITLRDVMPGVNRSEEDDDD